MCIFQWNHQKKLAYGSSLSDKRIKLAFSDLIPPSSSSITIQGNILLSENQDKWRLSNKTSPIVSFFCSGISHFLPIAIIFNIYLNSSLISCPDPSLNFPFLYFVICPLVGWLGWDCYRCMLSLIYLYNTKSFDPLVYFPMFQIVVAAITSYYQKYDKCWSPSSRVLCHAKLRYSSHCHVLQYRPLVVRWVKERWLYLYLIDMKVMAGFIVL